ncbi:chemotaxis protein CheW [Chitinibacter sp. GC72]|uniref:chemotaxis protein CheW n=1 Tax=Chitinibacter sp. GC72 TaxID=1526917 RepID=UPI0012F72A4C|nr:chemotaxis protein CheW [Chitinibacter sp. GC72]
MSIDMGQFILVFFDEAAEHLANMESLLLNINVAEPDSEDLNAIFRAAHSIKGGAATFGFADLTDVTHVLENLLDKIRKNEITLTAEMVDAFLQSGDVLQDMLSAHRGQGQPDELAMSATKARLTQLLTSQEDTTMVELDELTIVIQPGETFDETLLCRELDRFGTIDDFTPGDAYSPWLYRIKTTENPEKILDSMSFMIEPNRVSITSSAECQSEFGLFLTPAESDLSVDEGFGFFDDTLGAALSEATAATAEEAGYGFFQPIIEEAVVAAVSSTPAAVTPISRLQNERATDKAAESSIRVSVEKVDQLLNLVGELVITQSMLAQNSLQLDPVLHEKLLSGVAQLERNTRELQESVMSIRMMPISFVFNRYPRLVRDLAGKLGKQVELRMIGENTELDKGFIEKLSDPLTHLVRNSLDHGIEMPDVRLSRNKQAQGTLTLKAFHQGGNIVIEVSDDGAGLSRERILNKAKERGMNVNDNMSDNEVWMLIFEAGFSTAAEITDVSGRGVGMDVVRKNIQAMGGRVEIQSMTGVGSTMSIRLPLTLAILDGMSISASDELYIIPLTFIIESLQPKTEEIKSMAGRGNVINVRGEYLPLIALYDIFNLPAKLKSFEEGLVIILEAEGQKIALFVDDLLGQHQVVVKNLETNYRRVNGVAGATIMGDGHVAFILDVAALVKTAQHLSSSDISRLAA